MAELFELEQLVAIRECGTFSGAAERLHLSQPTVTRSMQRLERDLGVSLFVRSRNKVAFTEAGLLAVEYARKILAQVGDMQIAVRAMDRANRTISIGACTLLPMFSLTREVTTLFPNMTIAHEMSDSAQLLAGLKNGKYQLIIVPFLPEDPEIVCVPCETECLSIVLPGAHPLAHREGVYMHELDGESCLLYSEIGHWQEFHTRKMPHTRFLMQNDWYVFDQLTRSTSLPFFTSSLIQLPDQSPDRVVIPILDEEASVTYYRACRNAERERFGKLF